jgi:hypothetical protein
MFVVVLNTEPSFLNVTVADPPVPAKYGICLDCHRQRHVSGTVSANTRSMGSCASRSESRRSPRDTMAYYLTLRAFWSKSVPMSSWRLRDGWSKRPALETVSRSGSDPLHRDRDGSRPSHEIIATSDARESIA